jgi:hypothetical protein
VLLVVAECKHLNGHTSFRQESAAKNMR